MNDKYTMDTDCFGTYVAKTTLIARESLKCSKLRRGKKLALTV